VPSRDLIEPTDLRVPFISTLECVEHRTFAAQAVISAVDTLSDAQDLEVAVSVRVAELDRGNLGHPPLRFEGSPPPNFAEGSICCHGEDLNNIRSDAGPSHRAEAGDYELSPVWYQPHGLRFDLGAVAGILLANEDLWPLGVIRTTPR
jgi:hypothetical protein